MSNSRLGLLLFATSLVTSICLFWVSLQGPRNTDRPLVFVISIDAFRHDFIHRPESKVLRQLAKLGTYGPMISQFPSFTFTNHYSLVTGLYPRYHGIVANYFYDADLEQEFAQTNRIVRTHPKWWRAEPVNNPQLLILHEFMLS